MLMKSECSRLSALAERYELVKLNFYFYLISRTIAFPSIFIRLLSAIRLLCFRRLMQFIVFVPNCVVRLCCSPFGSRKNRSKFNRFRSALYLAIIGEKISKNKRLKNSHLFSLFDRTVDTGCKWRELVCAFSSSITVSHRAF